MASPTLAQLGGPMIGGPGYNLLDPLGGASGGSGGLGGLGGSASSGAVGNTSYAAVDPTAGSSFASQLGPLLQRLQGLQAPNYQDLVTQGINSPLLQSILKPALANLIPGETLARQNLMDEFRKGGALGSGAMGNASSTLETGLQGQRGNLVSQVLSQFLPQITQGLSNQFNQGLSIDQLMAQVLGQSKPSIVTGSNAVPGGGGSSGGGGVDDLLGSSSSMTPQQEWDQMNAAGFRNQGPRPGGGGYQPSPNVPDPSGGLDLTGLYQPNNLTSGGGGGSTYIGPEGYITPGSTSAYGPSSNNDSGTFSQWSGSLLTPPQGSTNF